MTIIVPATHNEDDVLVSAACGIYIHIDCVLF